MTRAERAAPSAGHPLLGFLDRAARGSFPPADGGVTLTPSLADGREAIVCFTGHAVIASRLTADDFGDTAPDGFGGALHPRVQLLMAGDGVIDVNDVTLVASGLGGRSELTETNEWDDHPRVIYNRQLRTDLAVWGDDEGFVTLGEGLAGRHEMGIEVREDLHNSGAGRRLIHEARKLVSPDAHVFAGVSPGNARSLRAFLSQGFVPVASEVIITPA